MNICIALYCRMYYVCHVCFVRMLKILNSIKMTDWKEYLSSLYFNPKLPSSYLGPEKL